MEIKVKEGGCESRVRIPLGPFSGRNLRADLRDSMRAALLGDVRRDVVSASEGYDELITMVSEYILGERESLPDSVMGKYYEAAYLSGRDTSRVMIRLFRSAYRKGGAIEIRGDGTSLVLPVFVLYPLFGLVRGELREYFKDPDRVLDFFMNGFEIRTVCPGDTGVVLVR